MRKLLNEEKKLREFVRRHVGGETSVDRVMMPSYVRANDLITALVRAVREDDAKILESLGRDNAAYQLRRLGGRNGPAVSPAKGEPK